MYVNSKDIIFPSQTGLNNELFKLHLEGDHINKVINLSASQLRYNKEKQIVHRYDFSNFVNTWMVYLAESIRYYRISRFDKVKSIINTVLHSMKSQCEYVRYQKGIIQSSVIEINKKQNTIRLDHACGWIMSWAKAIIMIDLNTQDNYEKIIMRAIDSMKNILSVILDKDEIQVYESGKVLGEE